MSCEELLVEVRAERQARKVAEELCVRLAERLRRDVLTATLLKAYEEWLAAL